MRKQLFFLFLILILSFRTQAQSLSLGNIQNGRVSQLSDQQILQLWQKFQSSGLTEEQAMKMLQQRGVSPSELLAFKQRVDLLTVGKSKSPAKLSAKKDSVNFSRDTAKTSAAAVTVSKLKPVVYGFDFFNNPNLKFEPNIRIATPKSYVLGPDDELIILLTGLNETTINSKISPEGNLKIPYAGLVHLAGYTIEQAQSLIKQRMQKIYPALASGQTQLNVTVGNVKSIRVTIIGEVKQPGTYTISSLSTLFNALYLSGGPGEKGSLRNIEIIRNNRVLKTVDFYSFLQKGLLTGNVRLEDQDVIRIPVYRKRVTIAGEIKRPGLYELKDSETLLDLIEYAGNYSDAAYRAMAKVVQMGSIERNIKDVPEDLFDRFVPKNADSVYFEPILSRYSNRVVLQGAVFRPGNFELTPGLTLSQLLKKADGLKEDAFLSRGYIKRTQPGREKEMLSFNLESVLAGTSDIPLVREDSVVVLNKLEMKDELTVTIDGFVRNPATFTYRRGMKAADVIAMSGGFTNDAASHRVEISRLNKNEADTIANQLLSIVSISIDSTLNNSGNSYLLEPLDYVHVPRLVNYHPLGNVSVQGELLFPGEYALQRRDETALDILKRAGGLTPSGSLPNAQLYRNGTRVDIDLAARKNRQDLKAMVLLPGDSLFIPKEMPFVEIAGAVNNPSIIRFNSSSFKSYIFSAGGVKENANLKGAYIQYPDGINKPVKRFLFFKNYPQVKPGSKIIVPEKAADFRFKLGLGEVGALTSAFTALISLIAVLSR